jgi:hypothetical protein
MVLSQRLSQHRGFALEDALLTSRQCKDPSSFFSHACTYPIPTRTVTSSFRTRFRANLNIYACVASSFSETRVDSGPWRGFFLGELFFLGLGLKG